MEFKEMFRFMKEGAKAKLPHWAGYWEWDDEKKTILMYCRPEESDTGAEVLDIRESQRVEYTLQNILSDKWIFAFNSNTPKLGGRAYMDFGDALHMARKWHKKIARRSWNGDYVRVMPEEDSGVAEQEWFEFNYSAGATLRWLPGERDLLADDWYVVD